MDLSSRIARALERGRGGAVSSLAAAVWGAASSRSLAKPLTLSGHARARVIAIGGATLGGSGKTPLAIACARSLALAGARVALVGHAYGARPLGPRVVDPGDDVEAVGDEALVAARALSSLGVPVVVAPSRQQALDVALDERDVVVLDGVAQLHPVRAHLALLAVDGAHPWGAGECPPRGDLRAPACDLLALCDRVVATRGGGDTRAATFDLDRPLDHADVTGEGAWLGDQRLGWAELRGGRVGLWTSVARPARVAARLAAAGVTPVVVATHGDHARVGAALRAKIAREAREKRVELWLCTPKCAARLSPTLEGVPVAILEHELRLEAPLEEALRSAAQLPPATSGA
jgi:tetraacyldisaccharide 4'-kinase